MQALYNLASSLVQYLPSLPTTSSRSTVTHVAATNMHRGMPAHLTAIERERINLYMHPNTQQHQEVLAEARVRGLSVLVIDQIKYILDSYCRSSPDFRETGQFNVKHMLDIAANWQPTENNPDYDEALKFLRNYYGAGG